MGRRTDWTRPNGRECRAADVAGGPLPVPETHDSEPWLTLKPRSWHASSSPGKPNGGTWLPEAERNLTEPCAWHSAPPTGARLGSSLGREWEVGELHARLRVRIVVARHPAAGSRVC